jgi:pimeloyl-ACP methyl ester carboxylesterase
LNTFRVLGLITLVSSRAAAQTIDSSSHSQRFVNVEAAVKLEVLDWGGTGRPIVLLAGNGATAHAFDAFAPKLTATHRVYGITRRGFGNSSRVTHGFLADSLAGDVLAVMDSLGIERPLLIGHSLAGTELSSIGSRHSEKVAGLVYLDTAFPQTFYDSSQTYLGLLMLDVQRKLLRLADNGVGLTLAQRDTVVRDLLDTSLPVLNRDLRKYLETIQAAPDLSVVAPPLQQNAVQRQLGLGMQKVTRIEAPVLAFFAYPPRYPQSAQSSSARSRFDSLAAVVLGSRFDGFERSIPGARVIRLPRADHYVFRSHESEVLAGIQEFSTALAATERCANAPAMRYLVDGKSAACAQVVAFPRERIESVDLIKGAAAAAYGAQPGEGVVSIRTKLERH